MSSRPPDHGFNTGLVPEPLEFPYGRSSNESSVPSLPNAQARRTEAESSATERPTTTQQRISGTRRVSDGPTTAQNPDWALSSPDTASDSTDSSDDEGSVPAQAIKSKENSRGQAHRRHALSGTKTDDSNQYGKFFVGNADFRTKGRVSKRDGRLNISVNETANSGYLAKALGATLKNHLGTRRGTDDDTVDRHAAGSQDGRESLASDLDAEADASTPTLNIVIMVIGSRGDIQPFLKIGKILKEEHGHRVRIATHPAFKNFVEKDIGLEFFSVGGDPSELMAFMVKNPGLIPSMSTVTSGEVGRRREAMFEMFQGFWRACINATDDEKDRGNVKMMADKHPFVADAIIANPPSFAHTHCAERLGIPLHLMFTFPYSPTQAFPHPLANIKNTNVDTNYTNFMSYPLVEMMVWQGLGDLINRFRFETLKLDPVSTLWAPGQLYRLKVPYTYLWSPGLVPKPADWGPEIDVAGFVFLDLAKSFTPPDELGKFLDAGPPPVYIGFGSIVVDDPDKFTNMIFEAIKKAGVRALVSKGWGGLGGENIPEDVYMLENTPHDWLFPKVSAVIHHGGAGTTAIGLKCGKPTMIVPFFGDQPFWAAMVAKAGAGYHDVVPYKRLNSDILAEGIGECLTEEAKANAGKIAQSIEAEGDGADNAVKSFHRSLALRGAHSLRCSILVDRVAVWRLKNSILRLSALAAIILVDKKKIHWRNLRLLRHYDWNDFDGPGEPFTGGSAAIVGSVAGVAKAFGSVPVRWTKTVKRHEKREQKRKQRADAKEQRRKQKMDTPSRSTSARLTTANGISTQDHAKSRPGVGSKSSTLNGTGGRPGIQGRDTGASYRTDDGSVTTAAGDENLAEELAADTGKAFQESGHALAKAPMELSLAVAQGFHNAPRLYGDSTVRRPVRITGMHSGLRAARGEFIYGVYDGVTGVVVQPYTGARDEGLIGFTKGVGKGVGGFVLKNLAAVIGPVAYTLKGVHKELQKKKEPTFFIRRARIIQGQKDLRELSDVDRKASTDAVMRGWNTSVDLAKLGASKKAEGIRGRIELKRQTKHWNAHGAFEDVDQAQRALEARDRGEDFDHVFAKQEQTLKKAEKPRQSTMVDAKGTDARNAVSDRTAEVPYSATNGVVH
ncbi:MAG: hypothetical protein M1817_002289 [Caeruleum heppii]|nr:MAG: hypothetical protein M1817_003526 [Caeruleum heppii]KAI9673652.1 MAG: hypothetical protein M1817_002289 [Caeruleum heppii]